MTTEELRNAIYDEFVNRYYQSELCDSADNFDYEMGNFGKVDVEAKAFELLVPQEVNLYLPLFISFNSVQEVPL